MTIFGFNSNVQRDDVTYHVESQARQSDLLLQTMIFVKGQCVGKHAFSYAAMTLEPGYSEEAMHALLKAQHKNAVEILEHGSVASVLASPAEIQDVNGSGLAVKWTNSGDPIRDNQAVVKLQVLDSGKPVVGATVSIRPYPLGDGRLLSQVTTDSSGSVSVPVQLPSGDLAVIVQATNGAKSITRKLRVKT